MKKFILAIVFIIGIFFNSFGNEPDGYWISTGELPLSSKSARHLAVYGDYLYIAGDFDAVHTVFAKNVARLHIPTGKWETLNNEEDYNFECIISDSSGIIYLCGRNGVKKWAGTTFNDLNLYGKGGGVYDLAVDSNNDVFVGNGFDILSGFSVLKWENDDWSEIGFGVATELASDSYGNIYASVSGKYYSETVKVGRWNGTSWELFIEIPADKINPVSIMALSADDNGDLYIGGQFSNIGDLSTFNIAKWNGTDLFALGDGISGDNSYISSMKSDKSGNLFVAGSFSNAGDIEVHNIAKWDGEKWSNLNGGTNGYISSIDFDDDGNLYALGVFSQAGGIDVKYLAKWDGTKWSTVFNYKKGYEHQVTALIKDSKGNIYAGGNFILGDKSSLIAKFDGKKLTNLGNAGFDSITSLTSDNSENLYAAGYFNKSDSEKTYSISKWNGTEWKQVGDNFNFIVNVLAGDNYGNLYAGGAFTKSGEISLNHIAKWNGTKWANLGSGIETPVLSMAFNKSGDLFAGGGDESFQYNSVFKWDGQNWDTIGSFGRVNGTLITSLAFDSMGNLYAGGDFWEVDGENGIYNIAKWDGKSWSAIGGKIKCESDYSSYCIRALAVDSDDNLYAGGYFYGVNDLFNPNFAKYNGTEWVDVNGGTNGSVHALAIDENNAVFVGGNFSAAGYEVSPYIAKYVVNETSDEDTDITDETDTNDNDVESVIPDTETTKKDKSGCSLIIF
ncbi:MAG TPA: hypothetical protein PKG52_04855 [bacterium]|nr:hypothetical protein [bacterium]